MYDVLKKHGVQLASNQVEYSLLRTLPEDSGLFAAMKERNIALLACKSITTPLPLARTTSNEIHQQTRLLGKAV